MRKLLSVLVLSLWAASVSAAVPADEALSRIRSRFAPDRRTARFEVQCHPYRSVVVLTGETTSAEAGAEAARQIAALYPARQVVDEVVRLPDSARLEGRTYGVVTIAVGTVRSEADYSSEAQTQLLCGMPVRILRHEGWYLIQTPEGYIGWIAARSIRPMTRTEFNAYIEAPKAVYLPTTGVMYTRPDRRSAPVTDLTAGALLRTLSEKGRFTEVALADGRTGWVARDEAEPFDTWKQRRPTAESVIATACGFMGTSYLWSGTSPKMMDCSGMVKTAYLLNGLVLARDASQQCLTGLPVDVSAGWQQLRPGDLVFFGSERHISHVGLYVGDGRFIHEAGLVHVSSFNPDHEEYSAHWLGRLRRAVRIIGSEDRQLGVWSVEHCPLYNLQ